jgi:hypothetical protein
MRGGRPQSVHSISDCLNPWNPGVWQSGLEGQVGEVSNDFRMSGRGNSAITDFGEALIHSDQ